MNKIFSRIRAFTLVELLVVIAIIAVLAGLLTPKLSSSRAVSGPGTTPYHPNFWHGCTNWSNVVVAASGTVTLGPATNDQITVRQESGDAWMLSLTTTNNSVGTAYVFYGVNDDGNTNDWTTPEHPVFIWPVAFNGSNTTLLPAYIAWTNFAGLYLNNARYVFPYMISNSCASNTIKINFLQESHDNGPT